MNKLLILCLLCISTGGRAAAADDLTPEQRANRIQVIDVFAAAATGTSEIQKVRFASYDRDLAARLWREYAPAFGEGDWNNAALALRHETIILSREGKTIVLSSRHRITEQNTDFVVTANRIVKLAGRDKEAVLRAGPPEYLARREAFDRLIEECDALMKESAATQPAVTRGQGAANAAPVVAAQAPVPAAATSAGAPAFQLGDDYPARMQAQRELLRAHERRRLLKEFIPPIQVMLIALPFSIPWFLPLLMVRKAALRAGLTSRLWLLPALAMSPLGWASAVSITYVTKGMIIFSILAPSVCALLLRFFPAAPVAAHNKWSEWGLAAVLLFYGSVSAVGAVTLYTATMASGSSEKAALGQLSSLRSSLQIYYGDKDGKEFPAGLYELIPRYMQSIPRVNTQSRATILHEASDRVAFFKTKSDTDDKGGWGYVNEPTLPGGAPNPEYGSVFINCTHINLRGTTRLCDY